MRLPPAWGSSQTPIFPDIKAGKTGSRGVNPWQVKPIAQLWAVEVLKKLP